MSEPKKIHISGGDFQGPSVSTSSMGRDVKPKFIEWDKWHYAEEIGKVITDRHIKEHVGIDKIALLLEPYELHPENYYEAAGAKYDWVLSHHKEWVERYDNWLYYPFGGTFLAEEDWGVCPKKNGISMFITKKDTMPGHRLRHKVFHAYPDVEYYGRGFREVDNKLEGLAKFPFQIVIESSMARGYFTEKLIDCFLTGTIPIYWGDPEIGEFFDMSGVIWWNGEMETLERIMGTVLSQGKNLWNDRLPHVQKNFITAQQFVCAEDQIWERHSEIFE